MDANRYILDVREEATVQSEDPGGYKLNFLGGKLLVSSAGIPVVGCPEQDTIIEVHFTANASSEWHPLWSVEGTYTSALGIPHSLRYRLSPDTYSSYRLATFTTQSQQNTRYYFNDMLWAYEPTGVTIYKKSNTPASESISVGGQAYTYSTALSRSVCWGSDGAISGALKPAPVSGIITAINSLFSGGDGGEKTVDDPGRGITRVSWPTVSINPSTDVYYINTFLEPRRMSSLSSTYGYLPRASTSAITLYQGGDKDFSFESTPYTDPQTGKDYVRVTSTTSLSESDFPVGTTLSVADAEAALAGGLTDTTTNSLSVSYSGFSSQKTLSEKLSNTRFSSTGNGISYDIDLHSKRELTISSGSASASFSANVGTSGGSPQFTDVGLSSSVTIKNSSVHPIYITATFSVSTLNNINSTTTVNRREVAACSSTTITCPNYTENMTPIDGMFYPWPTNIQCSVSISTS